MNEPNRDLLEDTLAEGSGPNSREELLATTLRMARRKRQLRVTRRAVPVVLVAVALAVLLLNERQGGHGLAESEPAGYTVVRTEPIAETQMVATKAGDSDWRLATRPAVVTMVATPADPPQVAEIQDEDLLNLLSPKPVALIRWGPHLARLVFINPADRDAVMSN